MKIKTVLFGLLILAMASGVAVADPFSGVAIETFSGTTEVEFPYDVSKIQIKVVGDPVTFTLAIPDGSVKYPDADSVTSTFPVDEDMPLTLGELGNVRYLRPTSSGTSTITVIYAKVR